MTNYTTATADPFLVVGFAILMIVMLVINIYILTYWQHPDDKSESVFPKILIVAGLQLSAVSVLMVPVDFANNMGSPGCDSNSILNSGSSQFCGGVDFFMVWQAFGGMICFTVIALVPFAIFYYEEDATDLRDVTIKKNRWLPALCYTSVFVFAFLILVLSLYFTVNKTEIPVEEYIYPLNITESYSYSRPPGVDSPYAFLQLTLPNEFNGGKNITMIESTVDMPVGFVVYSMGLLTWIGSWLFATFLGTGLASAPIQFIIAFIYRPKLMTLDVLGATELELQERSNEILEVTMLLKRERGALVDGNKGSAATLRRRYINDRLEVNKLTQMVFCLERDVEDFLASKNLRQNYNPLIAPFKLALGILFAMVSLVWMLQIILGILTNTTPFLSLYLLSFDSWFPMFGNLTYALLALYLLFCTIIGCFKMSMRLICIKVHPMKVGATYLNAFLFNLGVIMLCTMPLIDFCTQGFAAYAIDTDAYFLFVVQMNHLHFFRTFFVNKVFVWIILLVACVFLPYMIYRPRDQPVSTEDFRRGMMNRAGGTNGYSPVALELPNVKAPKFASTLPSFSRFKNSTGDASAVEQKKD
jgi:LMBR1 domain-containing protein 1